MAPNACNLLIVPLIFVLFLGRDLVDSQPDYNFYDVTCSNLSKVVKYSIWPAIANDTRMAASLLRLHFHDCIVNGCDGSVLLDTTSTFTVEKNASPNRNSARGFEVIDKVKADVEKACPSTVSSADVGGPPYLIPRGRRDGLAASQSAANREIPSPSEPLENIIEKFTSKGLDIKDMVVLSGGHTIGFAQCSTFKKRLFDFDGSGNPDPNLDTSLLSNLKNVCTNQESSDSNLAPLDPVTTNKFDNMYYKNLVNNSGLLGSDQALAGDNRTAAMVINYSNCPYLFYKDFESSMVKLGKVGVLTGKDGQIRKNCRVVN